MMRTNEKAPSGAPIALYRRTIVYATILVLLIALFIVQETTTTRRNTIPIPEISETIDQIRISDATTELTFHRSDDEWTLGTESYSVNPDTVQTILDEIEALEAVDIVTTRGAAEEYGLDEESRRTVRFFTGDLEPLAFQLGDTAAAGSGVYGRVNTSNEIVLLPDGLDTTVTTDPFRYREKTMAAITAEEIVEVRILSDRFETVRVQRKLDEDPATDETATDETATDETTTDETTTDETITDETVTDESPSTPTDAVETEWAATVDGEEIDAPRLNALIRELASLEATGFPEYDDPAGGTAARGDATASDGATATDSAPRGDPFSGAPFATVEVETTGGDTTTIELWPPDAERRIPAAATSSPYRFYLPEWRARRLLLGLPRYLDPYTEEPEA